MRRKPTRRRRSAAQWAQLLASWDRTTTLPEDFARRHGVSPSTLAWWCWRFKRDASLAPPADAMRFVRVDLSEDTIPPPRDDWEFSSPSGHTLRVRGAIDAASLALVLDRMTARSAR